MPRSVPPGKQWQLLKRYYGQWPTDVQGEYVVNPAEGDNGSEEMELVEEGEEEEEDDAEEDEESG